MQIHVDQSPRWSIKRYSDGHISILVGNRVNCPKCITTEYALPTESHCNKILSRMIQMKTFIKMGIKLSKFRYFNYACVNYIWLVAVTMLICH